LALHARCEKNALKNVAEVFKKRKEYGILGKNCWPLLDARFEAKSKWSRIRDKS
jgi:hypothetical protein